MINISGFSSSTLTAIILLLSIINIVFLHLLLTKSKYEKKMCTTVKEILDVLDSTLKACNVSNTEPQPSKDELREKILDQLSDSDSNQLNSLLDALNNARNNIK